MPFETCSAHAPWPEHTSPLSRPTGQAMAVVMSNAALSRRRLPMALGLPDGGFRSRGLLLVTLWLLPAIDASVPGRGAAPQRTPLQEPPHETRTRVLAPQLSPGVAETSLRSGTRLEGRRPELFKSAAEQGLCNQTLPQTSPRHVCGRGGAARPRLFHKLSIPAARWALPTHRQAAHPVQGSNTSASR